MDRALFQALNDGATVITPTTQLARLIRAQYAGDQRLAGGRVWSSPDVVSWDGWLRRSYESRRWNTADPDMPLLLSTAQEQLLWQRIIEVHQQDNPLLQAGAAALLAKRAWRLLNDWELDVPTADRFPGEDVTAFGSWVNAYVRQTRREGWTDVARLGSQAAGAMAGANAANTKRLVFLGFARFTLVQETCIDALRAAGIPVDFPSPNSLSARANRLILTDSEQEIRVCARWVRTRLLEKPDAAIAVVVPQLQRWRRDVERIFDEVLAPGRFLPGQSLEGRPYEMVPGEPATSRPAISAALTILRLGGSRIDAEDLSRVLRSPFVRGAQENAGTRALFDAWLREFRAVSWSVRRLSNLWQKWQDKSGRSDPSLEHALSRLGAFRGKEPHVHRPGDWSIRFGELLESFGWPGGRELSVEEQRLSETLRSSLEEYATLDAVATPAPFERALTQLGRLLAQKRISTGVGQEPVLILDQTDLSGLRFDALWVIGLHDESWPRQSSPNPFIPLSWQRRLQLPGLSTDLELEHARREMQTWFDAADTVVVSTPAVEDDRSLRLSPLVEDFPAITETDLGVEPGPNYLETVRETVALETLIDDRGPKLSELQTTGGTKIFRLQAACPFRAFAEIRLAAQPLEIPRAGMDPRDWGLLVHVALQIFWDRVRTSDALSRLISTNCLDEVIRETASEAMGKRQRGWADRFPQHYLELEKKRLQNHLEQWLNVERVRPLFEVVAVEEDRQVKIASLTIKTRVDRIDRISGRGIAIIDYKTGERDTRAWFDERPAEPQLPIYAIDNAEPLDAVLFAQLKPGNFKFIGVARDGDLIPSVEGFDQSRRATQLGLTWAGLQVYWRNRLERLAAEYAGGYASVEPRHAEQTCRNCHLSLLCRVHERRAAWKSKDD